MEESKQVSRRDFLKFAGIAGASVAFGIGIGGLAAGCGESTTTTTAATTATTAGTATSAAASGEPVVIAYNDGFTGFMAWDAQQTDMGIKTALAMLDNQMAGRPVKYITTDNGSDPVVGVDKAKQLVEAQGLDYMIGPMYSPGTQAVTAYLAKSGGIPDCSLMGQPSDNLQTANKLAFIPGGLYGSWGYYFGKYCNQQLGFKTVNCINYEDTAAHGLQDGFTKGFGEGGGQVLSVNYVPMDVVDFSSYLTTLKPADAMYFWIIGNGAVPFVKQCHDYKITVPLLSMMANNLVEDQLKELGDAGLGLIGCDIYTPLLDSDLNKQFVAAYQKLYPDTLPTTDGYTGWVAVMLYAEALKQTGGDTDPAKVIQAMASITIDTPSGKVTMTPYKDAYIGKRDLLIEKTAAVNGRTSWAVEYTWPQVLLGE
jgi:branched-chain amino acid transport system substrate-binding protein